MKSFAPSPEETSGSRIGRALSGLPDAKEGHAGFLMVPDGIDALAIRLLLADRAEVCIDAQYYEIENDLTGHLFIESLLRAADRGVRVRLLLDDYRTSGHDADLAALRMHKNFQMRIYNPFARFTARTIEGILSFTRVNRRMHNKSFTVDNQITVIGGRNIGNQYFSAGLDANFSDLDVLAVGPVVSDVSTMFDEYWNSVASTPIEKVASKFGDPTVTFKKLLDRVSSSRAAVGNTVYAAAINSSILETLEKDLNTFVWAPYQLAFDLPEKTQKVKNSSKIRRLLVEAFETARDEVVLISPYFVPRISGLRKFQLLRDRGIEVTVVTNSLASNNQIYAHGGYAPVRKALLKMGVTLYEFRSDANVVTQPELNAKKTQATLHAKAFAIDREKLFVGSFNFDPRSANINTEMGVFIESKELADMFVRGTKRFAPLLSYQVILDERGALKWQSENQETVSLFNNEPRASFWLRVAGRMAQLLPIRGQV